MWSLHMPFTISLRRLSLMLHGVHAQTAGIQTDVGQQKPWTQLSQLNPGQLQKSFMSKILTTGVAKTLKHYEIKQVCVAAVLQACVRKVPSTNISQDNKYLDWAFLWIS